MSRATTVGITVPVAARPSKVGRALRRAQRYPLIPLSIVVFVLIVPAIFATWLAPYDPLDGVLPARLQPPAWMEGGNTEHLLGTDKIGRDILSRILYGARVSLSVSVAAIVVSGTIGTALGIIAGYFGGKLDVLIMRAVDTSLSIPSILLALVLGAALQQTSIASLVFVIVVILWSRYARQIRGETLSVKERDFVARARVAGASNYRIITRHIFPNVVNTLIVLATLQVGYVILLESSLSFLGVGIPAPTPAWGLMVADGRTLVMTAWWIAFFPGLAILVTVLSLNLLGDWLRDRLDPKQRNV